MEKKVIVQALTTTLDYVNPQSRPWWQFWGENPNEEKANQVVDTTEEVVNVISTTATVLTVLWEVGSQAKHWLDEYMRTKLVPRLQPQLTLDANSPKKVIPAQPDLSFSYTSVFYPEVKANDEILGKSDPDLADFTSIVTEENVPATKPLQLN